MEVTSLSEAKGPGKFLGIGARMALIVGSAVTLINVVGGVWIYSSLKASLVGQDIARQEAAADSLEPQFTLGLRAARDDALFLSGVPPVGGIIRARDAGGYDELEESTEQQWLHRLSVLFSESLRSHSEYLQIRLIGVDDGGREIVHVDRDGPDIVVVPPSRLEQHGDLPYFRAAIRIRPGQVYLAAVELNREWGRVVKPRIPVLKAATPVHRPDGTVFGAVVINVDLRECFAAMRTSLSRRYDLYLFNQKGDFLIHPDPNVPFALQLGKPPSRVEDEFPGLLGGVLGRDERASVVEHSEAGRVVASVRKLHADPGNPERWWGLLLTSDYEIATAPSVRQRNEFILLAGLLLVVTLATITSVSRHLTQPLRRITAAVQTFPNRENALDLPLHARDEAGVLARAFDDLSHRVLAHEAVLRAEVDERHRAETALRGAEQRLQLALAAAEAGVWEWDTDGKVVWGGSMARLFGAAGGEFKGTLASWQGSVHPDDWRAFEAALYDCRNNHRGFNLDLRAKAPSGDWRHLKVRGTALSGEHGGKVIGVCWDISDERLAQQRIQHYASQLEQRNREMEQFVYSVSHDLKAPLVTCKGFLGIVREELQDGNTEQALSALQRLERGAQQMTRLIEDLLQFSRVGRVSNNPEPLDPAALAREIAESLQQDAEAREVRIDIQDDMPRIMADPMAVSRVFHNLLANAFKYGRSAPQPRIEVGGHVAEHEILFFVRDNGAGIAKEYQHKIFGLFQRLETDQEGTGIGLAVVAKIMEVHGGRAWVESGDGQGATFWLAFPIRYLTPAPAVLAKELA